MDRLQTYHVYIMANKSRMLCVGVMGDLAQRGGQHRKKAGDGYTARYNITRLVYYQAFGDPGSAIRREKEIKGRRRSKKMGLGEGGNPDWRDLSGEVSPFASPADPAEARSRARARREARASARAARERGGEPGEN